MSKKSTVVHGQHHERCCPAMAGNGVVACKNWVFHSPIEIPCIGELSISALTAIDTATGLAELVCIDNKTLAHIALKLEHMWLACYP